MKDFMEKCACKGSFLDKFLQPAILIILKRGPSHGFQLIADLEKSGMVSGDSLDPAGLYRSLKRMEAGKAVTSYWDTETGAKPRRIYSITEYGIECLSSWEKTLREYKGNLEQILTGLEQCNHGTERETTEN